MKNQYANGLDGWLAEVFHKTAEALALEEALHTILDSMVECFPCQSIAILLIDEDTKELRIKMARRITYTFMKQFRREAPGPAVTRVVLEQQPLLVSDANPRSDLYAELKLEHDFGAAAVVPLLKDHRGIGYLFCDRCPGESFAKSDLVHLQVVALLINNLMEKFELLRERKQLSPLDDASGALKYSTFVPALCAELKAAGDRGRPVTLAIADVPSFRNYLEMYGVPGAHALLAGAVAAVRPHLRKKDLLGRYGADEFILCLSGANESEARRRLLAIHADIVARSGGGKDLPVQAFIGALVLDDPKDMRHPQQDILAVLGRHLMDAKTRRRALTLSRRPSAGQGGHP